MHFIPVPLYVLLQFNAVQTKHFGNVYVDPDLGGYVGFRQSGFTAAFEFNSRGCGLTMFLPLSVHPLPHMIMTRKNG